MFIFHYCELHSGNTGTVDLQTSHGLSDMSVRICRPVMVCQTCLSGFVGLLQHQ